MAYTIYTKNDSGESRPMPIAFTAMLDLNDTIEPEAFSWIPEFWECDPCAMPGRRYTVKHPAGQQFHAWYEVILVGYDDDTTIQTKLDYFRKVQESLERLNAAQKDYNQLIK